MSGKTWLAVGAVLACLSVVCGAFGAHWLNDKIPLWYPDDAALQAKRLGDWETAARYHMYHALAIVAIGLALLHGSGKLWQAAAWTMTAGIVLFSGSLYVLVISTNKTWGAVTPFGGLLMIAGWILLAWAALASRNEGKNDQ
jgi:uncharacterized membrane protein YgdD (TMEM256/DUF423 family)